MITPFFCLHFFYMITIVEIFRCCLSRMRERSDRQCEANELRTKSKFVGGGKKNEVREIFLL